MSFRKRVTEARGKTKGMWYSQSGRWAVFIEDWLEVKVKYKTQSREIMGDFKREVSLESYG